MANKKGYSLEKGFLFDYGWLDMFRSLPPKDAWTLLSELIEYQRTCGQSVVPSHPQKPILDMMAATVVYQIDKRLKGAKVPTIVSTEAPTMVGTVCRPPLKEVEEEEEKGIKNNTPPTPSCEGSGDGKFDRFWNAYPKKVGKKDALGVFSKLKPTEELLSRMLTAIETQKQCEQWRREGGRFIPNPATWLRQGRWDDEPTRAASASGTDNVFLQLYQQEYGGNA